MYQRKPIWSPWDIAFTTAAVVGLVLTAVVGLFGVRP